MEVGQIRFCWTFLILASQTIVSIFPKILSRPGSFVTAIHIFGEFIISSFSLRCRLRCVGNYRFFEIQIMKEIENDRLQFTTMRLMSNAKFQISMEVQDIGAPNYYWRWWNGADWTNEPSFPILSPHEVTSVYPSSGPRSRIKTSLNAIPQLARLDIQL